MIFLRLFKYGSRVGKGIVNFCHPLQGANCSMLLVQNSLRNVNIMTFENILRVYFCSRQVCFKDLKIKLTLLNLKHGTQRSHSDACILEKCTLPYIKQNLFCYQMSCQCVVFWN